MTNHIDDELPIFASLNTNPLGCDCCGKSHMLRAIYISSTEIGPINLGVKCCGKWFDLNLTGNPYKAVKKLNVKFRKMSNSEIADIIDQIKDSEREWQDKG